MTDQTTGCADADSDVNVIAVALIARWSVATA